MRFLIVLATVFTITGLAAAQQGAPPATNPGDLDAVLAGWEKALLGIKSLEAACQRTTLDKVFETKEIYKGTAMFLKAPGPGQGSRASLELHKVTNPSIFEKYICTGTYLYEYAPASKVIRIHDLPKPKGGQISDDNFLAFLFGMKAAEAKQRYQLTLTPPDNNYYYLQIQPKLAQDKADFTVARLVLRRMDFLPAQVWFHQPNGNEVTWDFQPRANVNIPATVFEQPKLPADWKFDRMQGEAKLKVRGGGP